MPTNTLDAIAVGSPMVVALQHAECIARRSKVAQLSAAALDDSEWDEGSLEANLASVRRVLSDAYRSNGSKRALDSDANNLLKRLNTIDDGKLGEHMCEALSLRENAAYVYGLALGILLGKGGVR